MKNVLEYSKQACICYNNNGYEHNKSKSMNCEETVTQVGHKAQEL